MPGVSTSTIWLLPSMTTPRTGKRVVCTLGVTIDTLPPTSRLDQGRLAGVGRADHGGEAGAGVWRGLGHSTLLALEQGPCCGLFGLLAASRLPARTGS